jgi:hypothetical protein
VIIYAPVYRVYKGIHKQWYNLFRLYTIVNLTYIREAATSFPGLSYEDEARHEKALVWAGHVTTKNGSI